MSMTNKKITRKEFLEKAIALGISLPVMSMLMASCSKEADLFPNIDVNFSGDIIIIGAGAAGLTAGYLLDKYNIDFQIIEASSTFGGRLKRSTDFADFPIDLGAEWIHDDPSILARLISDPSINANVELIPYSPDTVYNWKDGKLKKQNWGANFYSEYKFKDISWFGFFEKYIASGILDKIVYNSPINEINYSNNRVMIKNIDGDVFEADKVLITTPIKILQEESISFIPSLSNSKINAINSINMPDGLKVFIEFSERFYPDILFTGSLLSEVSAGDKVYYDAAFRKNSNRNIMGLFTVDEKASVFTSLANDSEIIEAVLKELDTIFNGQASRYYIKHVVQNWSKEPYIQGSYSIEFQNDQADTINRLIAPVEHKLYFAGEAMSLDNGATVHGASETGYSAVELMLS